MAQKAKKALTIKTLTKSSVWDLQENDIFRLWEAAEKDADLKDNARHYTDVIRSAFEVEEVKVDKPEVIKKYEARGCQVGQIKLDENTKLLLAIKKKPIMRITDLTYENITHISAIKLIEVLDRNFGGGWDSIPQNIKDIIESGFDISTTTLPKDRLKKKGSMYEKKVNDGFEVLEIAKGTWVEAIFAKVKPVVEKPEPEEEIENIKAPVYDPENDDEDLPEFEDPYNDDEDDDDVFDEDRLTEESYRTTFDEDPEDLDLSVVDAADDDDY